jgi:hypothetical protein
MWQSIWQWIASNKLFEGAAVGLFSLIGVIIKRLSKTPNSPATVSNSNVTVPIQINNFPNTPSPIDSVERKPPTPEHSALDIQKPVMVSLQPRTCSVEDEPHDEYGFVEGVGGKAQIAVATFQRGEHSFRGSLHLTAWIRYWTIPPDRNLPMQEIARVKNGAWLEENYNTAIMNVPDTKEVVLALQAEGELAVVQDNRFNVYNNRGFHIVPIPESCNQMYVSLDVVDEKYGRLSYNCFRIRREPFQIERTPAGELPVWEED